jgi:hypothetical protein
MSLSKTDQYETFLFINERTLLTVAVPVNVAEPFHAFVQRLENLLAGIGIPDEQIAAEIREFSDIQIGKAENRSVVLSMTALAREYLDRLQPTADVLSRLETEIAAIVHPALPKPPRELAIELLSSCLQGEAS